MPKASKMKLNRSVIIAFVLLVAAATLYRVWPERPFGFAPQWAMAIFAGAIMKDKRWAFLLPLLSMFVSDALYQVLYINGITPIAGFYEGQVVNYILFGSLVFFGLMIRRISVARVLSASLAAPSAFFLVSNLLVWMGGGGYARPKTFTGLLQCYADGVPFYQMSLVSSVIFSAVFFGVFAIATQRKTALA